MFKMIHCAINGGRLVDLSIAKRIVEQLRAREENVLDFTGITFMNRRFYEVFFVSSGTRFEIINADPALHGIIEGFAKQREEIRVTFVD